MPHTGPSLTVDCVVFDGDAVVLIKRKYDPYAGSYALPGGFVEIGETVEAACAREMVEETGLVVADLQLIGVYSDPNRDPRRHTVTVAFLGRANVAARRAGSDAASVELVSNWQKCDIAFDHREIIEDAWRLETGRRTHLRE